MELRLRRLDEMLKELREAKCENTNKSLLKAFSEELRDCRRGRNWAHQLKLVKSQQIILAFLHLLIYFYS